MAQTADRADPRFKAYSAAEAKAAEEWTAPAQKRYRPAALGGGASAGASASAEEAAAAQQRAALPLAKTVLELFERQAHWKKDEAIAALRGSLEDKEVQEELRKKGDYLRRGRYIGHYICRTAFRTPSMPQPDPAAEEERGQ